MAIGVVIGIPMGDPAGIGPEIILKALDRIERDTSFQIVVCGDNSVFHRLEEELQLPIPSWHYAYSPSECKELIVEGKSLIFFHIPLLDGYPYRYGEIQGICGKAAYESIRTITELALEGIVDVVATPPLHKEALRAGGIDTIGHTEILGTLTNSSHPVTMFETLNLKVFFMTRHLSLRDACDAVTFDRVLNCIRECNTITLKGGFDTSLPLAVAALNPHGGEHGLFGDEEERVIKPALNQARAEGIAVEGPIGADSVFHLARIGLFRAVISLYHDQGHIATKTLDFERTISVTWNLPFVRTSVDHGTAFDIAGKGIASSVSMQEAIRIARVYGTQSKEVT